MLRIEIVFVKCLIQSITFRDKYGPRTGDGDGLYLKIFTWFKSLKKKSNLMWGKSGKNQNYDSKKIVQY